MALTKYPLDRSGLQITRVGYGSSARRRLGIPLGQDDRESLAAMQHTIDFGVNWIDTATRGRRPSRGAGAMAPA